MKRSSQHWPRNLRNALRDHATPSRVNRVWERLEAELSGVPARRKLSFWWAVPATLGVFGAGIMVGAHLQGGTIDAPSVSAELPRSGAGRVNHTPLAAATAPLGGNEPAENLPVHRQVQPAAPVKPKAISAKAVTSSDVPSVSDSAPISNTGTPEWQRLASRGDFAAARKSLDEQGGFESAMAGASPEDLLILADIARATTRRDIAIVALRRVVAQPAAPEAPLAAWTLGNLLDQSGDHVAAINAFALYQRLSPTGDFAEDAAARQVDAALSQGSADFAKQLFDQYAKAYPAGRRLAELRHALAKLNPGAADAGARPESDHDDPEDDLDPEPAPAEPVPAHK